MHLFVDESGDFAIPADAKEHRVAVVAALTFTDPAWDATRPRFERFKAQLGETEMIAGEPKWHRLTGQHQREYCDLMAATEGVSFTPVTLDLSHLAAAGDGWLAPFLSKLDEQPELMLHESAKNQIRELAKQARNLSSVQHLRLYSWAYSLHQAFYHAIVFLSEGTKSTSWNAVRIEVDPVQPRPKSREQRVFSLMVLAWMMGWSKGNPFITVEGVHTADHPFVRNFETPEGIDFGKLIRPNLHWLGSKQSIGLQMADLAATAVHSAASDLKSGSPSMECFQTIMRSSRYGWRRGPGLFSPATVIPPEMESKYAVLSDAMRRRP